MKPDDLYSRAREILLAEPTMGKKRLADKLGIRTPTSRRLLWRFRGETQGHSPDREYDSVRKLKEANPDWGVGRIAQALRISEDRVMLNLARWTGAQEFKGKPISTPGDSTTAATPDAPNAGSTLQDDVGETTRDLCYRGSQIRSLDDLLVYAQVDTSVWEVERWMSNKWEVGARNPATGEILTAPLFQVKAWLKRKIVENTLKEFAQELLEGLKKEAPAPAPAKYPPQREGMLEIAMFDIHIEKLCWECNAGVIPITRSPRKCFGMGSTTCRRCRRDSNQRSSCFRWAMTSFIPTSWGARPPRGPTSIRRSHGNRPLSKLGS